MKRKAEEIEIKSNKLIKLIHFSRDISFNINDINIKLYIETIDNKKYLRGEEFVQIREYDKKYCKEFMRGMIRGFFLHPFLCFLKYESDFYIIYKEQKIKVDFSIIKNIITVIDNY